ncbi:MAG: hypothetical protein BAJALOKI1v1_2170005 [Promethearchaeota archaeon]|nr:MAG: hypothetical protein BAJALOKI1v1_2170005 [Candidatus Lokiarchaeota archaeon]
MMESVWRESKTYALQYAILDEIRIHTVKGVVTQLKLLDRS